MVNAMKTTITPAGAIPEALESRPTVSGGVKVTAEFQSAGEPQATV